MSVNQQLFYSKCRQKLFPVKLHILFSSICYQIGFKFSLFSMNFQFILTHRPSKEFSFKLFSIKQINQRNFQHLTHISTTFNLYPICFCSAHLFHYQNIQQQKKSCGTTPIYSDSSKSVCFLCYECFEEEEKNQIVPNRSNNNDFMCIKSRFCNISAHGMDGNKINRLKKKRENVDNAECRDVLFCVCAVFNVGKNRNL